MKKFLLLLFFVGLMMSCKEEPVSNNTEDTVTQDTLVTTTVTPNVSVDSMSLDLKESPLEE